jgi:hypothetical protein
MFILKVQTATTEFQKVQTFLRHLWGYAVVHLVEKLRYKPEVREFDSR